MEAPIIFEMPVYSGFYSEHLATAGKAHSLLNAETDVAEGFSKERLLADLRATADKLDAQQEFTSAIHLRQEAKRLR